ncbi:uncharacterized protein [Diadema setosum]|uniref:uncharacterized protein n=1 Tax=Diadema setosum TaxID=31175 RepID=UPI003B3BC718
MEKFRSSTSFSASTSVNCVSNGGNVLSPTTIDHLPVNRAMSVSPSHGTRASTAPQSAVQQRGFSSTGHEGTRVPEMTGNEESVSSKLEASISPDAKQKVESLLADVRKLGEKEKLWLYLQLPSGNQEQEASYKSSSPMLSSSRVEQTTAINWVRSHIEESADTSLPKKEVYEEYRSFCESSNHRALSTADFGKVIKGVFPMVQARRLGTRGNSRYCYSGVKKKTDLTSPSLSLLDAPAIKSGGDILQGQCTNCPASLCSMDDDHLQLAATQVICEWASNVTSKPFTDFVELAQHLTSNKLVTRCSKSILIVQSHTMENFRHDLTPEMRHRETNYHLKQALQYRQEVRKKQAEENQQRLQGVLSPAQFKQQATAGSSEELTTPQPSQTDKATQLEQRDVNAVRDGTSSSSYVAEGNDTSTNVENNMSSSNTSGESNSASKESPGKRRFAPIQPKTPVRDTNPAQMVLISPSAKPNGQQIQLLVVKGQQAIQMQGVPKLPNQQQMNVVLQGQNVFSSPVQTVAAVGNQTPVNVVQPVGNQIVGNAVLSSQVIPATSIQNVIKSGGQVVIVGNQVKNLQGVCGGYKTVTNTNAAIQQNPGQNVAPNQVALVAQAVPPQPNTVVPTTNVACQKTVLSSQGIAFNTGTSNTRSQNVTPVFVERTLSSVVTSDSSPVTKLTSATTTPVRTTVSSLVPMQNTQSVVTNGQSSLPTTVTFATQPMKLSSVLINPEPFQGNSIPIQTNTVDQNRQATGQPSIASPSVQFGKLDKAPAAGRIVKNTVNISAAELMRSMSSGGKAGMTQNGGGKTVATLLSQRSAQTITSRTSSPLTSSSSSLLSPKEATTSTLVNLPGNVVLAQVQMPAQNLQSQQEQNKLAQLVVHSGREEPTLGNDSSVTSANNAEIAIGRQDLIPQQNSLLSRIMLQQNGGKQLLAGNNNVVPIQQMTVDETSGILGPDVAQPSISLLPDADTSANTMLTVSGMSAAMMLPHKSKPEQLGLVSNLPQSQSSVAINNQSLSNDSHPGTAQCPQSTKVAIFNPNDSTQPKMLERLLTLDDLSYIGSTVPKEVRSVPTTPIPELPAVGHMVRAQSAAIPMQQGSESIPPSPSDGKSFSFTPINTVELDGGESPLKLRFKPKPTHPVTSTTLNQVLMNTAAPDQGQDLTAGGKGKGKRQQQSEFVTPTRKRRPSSSSKRPPTASPVSLQYQQQQQQQLRQNMISPAPKQIMPPQATFLLQSAQPGPNIQLLTQTGAIVTAGAQSQQAMWQRRRNPSGPACPTINNPVTQEAVETELRNFLQNSANVSDLQAMIVNKRVLQNRSQSVPLPEQPANRLLGQPLTSQYPTQQDYLPSQSDMVATQVMPTMTADQVRQIQAVQLNNFSAKRNLNQDLLDLEVTEADFEPYNDHMGTSSSNIQEMSDLSSQSWSAGQEEPTVVTSENGADYNLKYDIAPQRVSPAEIAESQNLFAEAQSFNDTSNSTASSIGDSMMMDDLPENMFQEMGEEQGCDLPLTPWQMGTRNTSLSTLECGM